MNGTKVSLSAKEMKMITNTDWILTKNAIIKKTITLLGTVQENQQFYLQEQGGKIPAEVLERSPKISKGENYKGLPYLVLDYPRVFDKKNILVVRILFWWGNFFSITLHLSGRYKNQYEKKIVTSFSELKKAGFSVCINQDEWEHHFEKTNYVPVTQFELAEFKKIITENSFVKLAKKFPLQDWDNVGENLVECFKKITDILMT